MSQFNAYETENYDLPPDRIVSIALQNRCKVVVFAYTEPIVAFENTIDVARAAKSSGLKTALVTAGFVDSEPLKELCQWMDVIRIDLKSFKEEFYRDVVEGSLKPVLSAMKTAHNQGVWIEIVDPLVPNFNDSPDEIREMSKWIVENLSSDVPLHLLRFFPAYKMRNHPPTSESTLLKARQVAIESGLNYVYIGNMPGHEAENTFCPRCKKRLITRAGYLGITENNILNGKCKFCNNPIPGLWKL